MSEIRNDLVYLEEVIARKNERIALLEKERNIVMKYVFDEPPFDAFSGIDLHEEASVNASVFGRVKPNREDYYAAFLTCISEGYLEEGE